MKNEYCKQAEVFWTAVVISPYWITAMKKKYRSASFQDLKLLTDNIKNMLKRPG